MADWRILREFGINDVSAFIEQQTSEQKTPPEALFLPSGTIKGFATTESPDPTRTRFAVTFLDAFKKYLLEGRGTFDYQYIEAVFERDASGVVIPESFIIFDSVEFTGGLGYRVILSPTLSNGTVITLRVFNIDPPQGTQFIRVFYREL